MNNEFEAIDYAIVSSALATSVGLPFLALASVVATRFVRDS